MAIEDWSSVQDFHHACTTLPLPTLIDEIAARKPSRPFVSLPINNEDLSKGYRDVTYSEFARAVDRCAWWIVSLLGQCESGSGRTLAYVGPQDLRYAVLMLGAVKGGYTLQTFHPEIPAEHCLSLMQHTGCKFLLFAQPMLPIVYSILSAGPMTVLAVPSLLSLLFITPKDPSPQMPFSKTLAEVCNEPFNVVHSSGSTGPPKPILWTHGAIVSYYSSFCKITSDSGANDITYAHFRGLRALVAVPISIAAGLFHLLGESLVYHYTVALPPPWTAMTPETLDQVHMYGEVQVTMVSPKHFRDITQNPSWLKNLSRLQYLAYLGAPCPSYIGGILSTQTRVTQLYGTTESGMLPLEITDAEDWEYISFNPILPYEMRPVCQDLYEIVILRRESDDSFQGIFTVYPDLPEWKVQDLFSKHPRKDNVWLYRGRTEDLVVSSSGETFLPKSMEGKIESHPSVNAALITDRGRAGLALLVEPRAPTTCEEQKQRLLDDIWPTVQSANEICPVKQRIQKGFVVVTGPMPRTMKGYAKRKIVYKLYEKDIDELYHKEEMQTKALENDNLSL